MKKHICNMINSCGVHDPDICYHSVLHDYDAHDCDNMNFCEYVGESSELICINERLLKLKKLKPDSQKQHENR